jgi:flagellar basal body rod protein FlgC
MRITIQPLAVNQFSEDETGLNLSRLPINAKAILFICPTIRCRDEDGYVRMSNVNVITEMTDTFKDL